MIYVVNGFPCSGKTSFESMILRIMGNAYCLQVSSIDCVKRAAFQFGWKGGKSPSDRKFLSDLKKLLVDYNDYPYTSIKSKIDSFYKLQKSLGINEQNSAVFIDCREPSEIQKFVDRLDARTILIRRPGDMNQALSNESDQNILKWNYDIEIQNNETLYELAEKAYVFVLNEGLHMKDKDFIPFPK